MPKPKITVQEAASTLTAEILRSSAWATKHISDLLVPRESFLKRIFSFLTKINSAASSLRGRLCRVALDNQSIGFRAREAWRKYRAWGVSPRAIAFEFLARAEGGSCNREDIVDHK